MHPAPLSLRYLIDANLPGNGLLTPSWLTCMLQLAELLLSRVQVSCTGGSAE